MHHNNSIEAEKLYRAVTMIENENECKAFFEDICTVNEINSIAQRLEVARLLKSGRTFNDIVTETGASTATISRVNRCLLYGAGGYDNILKKLNG